LIANINFVISVPIFIPCPPCLNTSVSEKGYSGCNSVTSLWEETVSNPGADTAHPDWKRFVAFLSLLSVSAQTGLYLRIQHPFSLPGYSLLLIKLEGSLSFSQQPATGPYPEPRESNLQGISKKNFTIVFQMLLCARVLRKRLHLKEN
jgi:hypothetical protein